MSFIKSKSMKNIYILLFAALICLSLKAQTQVNLQWLNTATSHYNGGSVYVQDIALGDDSSLVAVGYFYLIADFDPGPDTFNLNAVSGPDIFIAKYNKYGELVYAYSFGGEGSLSTNEGAYSVVVDKPAMHILPALSIRLLTLTRELLSTF